MANTQSAAKSKAATAPKVENVKKPRVHTVKKGTLPAAELKMQEIPADVAPPTEEQRNAERRQEEDRRKQAQADAAMQFAVQQMTGTPAVMPANAPPEALEEYAKELAALQLKFDVKPAPGAPKSVHVRTKLQSNGITRPGANTVTGKVWEVADALSVPPNGVATIAAIKAHEALKAVNDHTIKTQYSRWRQYNGVTGRLPKLQPNPVKVTIGEDEGLSAAVKSN